MEKLQNLLIVGGTGRNVGKTECLCRIIARVGRSTGVYALKVSAVYPDEEIYHGHHVAEKADVLVEEIRREGHKDTIRMVRAGAQRVFYLRGDRKSIRDGFAEFLSMVPRGAAIICESNSLSDIVTPGLLVVVRGADGEVKSRAVPLLAQADLVVVSDKQNPCLELDAIDFGKEAGWRIALSAGK